MCVMSPSIGVTWCVSNLIRRPCQTLKAGDSRPGFLDEMVNDESKREGRVGLLILLAKQKRKQTGKS